MRWPSRKPVELVLPRQPPLPTLDTTKLRNAKVRSLAERAEESAEGALSELQQATGLASDASSKAIRESLEATYQIVQRHQAMEHWLERIFGERVASDKTDALSDRERQEYNNLHARLEYTSNFQRAVSEISHHERARYNELAQRVRSAEAHVPFNLNAKQLHEKLAQLRLSPERKQTVSAVINLRETAFSALQTAVSHLQDMKTDSAWMNSCHSLRDIVGDEMDQMEIQRTALELDHLVRLIKINQELVASLAAAVTGAASKTYLDAISQLPQPKEEP